MTRRACRATETTNENKGHKIEISQPSKYTLGGRVKWSRAIYIDGKFADHKQHKNLQEAVWYAQRLIEALAAK